MLGDLITLPLRLSARAASLALRGTEAVVGRALAVVGRSGPPAPSYESYEAPPAPSAADTPVPEPQPEAAAPEPVTEPPSSPEREVQMPETPAPPAHVSEEPELTAEFAEPGAEEGAGAEVHVAEPWDGYAELHADDVIDRVAAADAAELVAVGLYERAHQGRQTVLDAVERQLAAQAAQAN